MSLDNQNNNETPTSLLNTSTTNQLSTTYKQCMYASMQVISNSWFHTLNSSTLNQLHNQCVNLADSFYQCENECEKEETIQNKIKCWKHCMTQ